MPASSSLFFDGMAIFGYGYLEHWATVFLWRYRVKVIMWLQDSLLGQDFLMIQYFLSDFLVADWFVEVTLVLRRLCAVIIWRILIWFGIDSGFAGVVLNFGYLDGSLNVTAGVEGWLLLGDMVAALWQHFWGWNFIWCLFLGSWFVPSCIVFVHINV